MPSVVSPPRPQPPQVLPIGPGAVPGQTGAPTGWDPLPPPEIAVTGGEQLAYGTAWQQWWKYNGDPYLKLRTLVSSRSATTGASASAAARVGYGPSAAQIRATVVPALKASLTEASSTEIVRGALIALARIGKGNDLGGMTLDYSAQYYLENDHQPSTDSALVALGLRADEVSIKTLFDLMRNNAAGQDLRGGQSVDARTRVFAIYALGLLSRRSGDLKLSGKIGRELTRAFVTDETATFEMHVALMLSMGLAPEAECDGTIEVDLERIAESDAHICRGTQIAALLNYFEDQDRPYELRAHAAVPLARLGHDAIPQYKQAVAEVLQNALNRRSKQHMSLHHSCVIALGALGDGDEDKVDQGIRETLRNSASRGDDLQQRLAMISLARVAAREGQAENKGVALRKTQKYLSGKMATGRGDLRAWAAIALSILGHDRNLEVAEIPAGIAATLRDSLNSRSSDRASAAALGIGILRDYDSEAALLKRLGSNEPTDVRSFAALALGMMEARDAVDSLTEVLSEEELDPVLIGSVSIALRLLGQTDIALKLLSQVDELEETDDQVALISATGVLGDSTAIEGLIALMNDDSREDALRGSAALALGVLCDNRTQSWTAEISEDINYNLLTWTLRDPFGDGMGILDMR